MWLCHDDLLPILFRLQRKILAGVCCAVWLLNNFFHLEGEGVIVFCWIGPRGFLLSTTRPWRLEKRNFFFPFFCVCVFVYVVCVCVCGSSFFCLSAHIACLEIKWEEAEEKTETETATTKIHSSWQHSPITRTVWALTPTIREKCPVSIQLFMATKRICPNSKVLHYTKQAVVPPGFSFLQAASGNVYNYLPGHCI